jgi:hypothetical protein
MKGTLCIAHGLLRDWLPHASSNTRAEFLCSVFSLQILMHELRFRALCYGEAKFF